MISKQHGLLVFIDGHPSDTLGDRPDESASVAGVVSNVDQPVQWLRQYKKSRDKQRLNMVKRLALAITAEDFELNAVCCFTSFREVERYGSGVLNCVPDKIAQRVGDKFKFKEFELARDIAVYAAWYAAAMAFIGQQTAGWANTMGVQHVQLICDHFPGNTAKVMHAVMAASLHCVDLRECWEMSKKRHGVEFGVSNLAEVLTSDGTEFNHKDYVGLQFADWMAHAHYAYTNPDQFWDHDTPRVEDYRKIIELPWISLASKGRAKSIELGPGLSPDPKAAIQRGPFQTQKYTR